MPFFGGGSGSGGDYTILVNDNVEGNGGLPLVTGINNIALGVGTLANLAAGSENIGIGTNVLPNISTQNNILYIGNVLPDAGDVQNVNLSDSIFVGKNVAVDTSGDSATCTFTNSVVIGNSAANTFNTGGAFSASRSVIIGDNAGGGAVGYLLGNVDNSVCIGEKSRTYNTDTVAVGQSATTLANGSIAIGKGATAEFNSIVIGANVSDSAVGGGIYIGGAETRVRIGAYAPDFLGVYTWATKPAAAAGNANKRVFISDVGVGGSYWFSDGARWRPVGGRVMLHALFTAVTSVANTNEQILDQYLAPAGLFSAGDKVAFTCRLDKSAAVDTCTRSYRVGALGTVADATLFNQAQPSTTNAMLAEYQPSIFQDVTTLVPVGTGLVSFNNVRTAIPANVTVPNITAVPIYFSITTKMTAGSETMALREFSVELISGA